MSEDDRPDLAFVSKVLTPYVDGFSLQKITTH